MTLIVRLNASNDWADRALGALASPLLLITRCYVAWQFLKSGWLKLPEWDTTLFLFQEEYHVRVFMLTVDPTHTQITTGPLVTDTAGGWNASRIDYDGDGKLDLSIAPKAGDLRNTPIYHNEGNGTFRKVTTNAIAQAQVNSWSHVWGDYDNDGKPDLFVPNTQGMNDMLFHNEGNGVFTRITAGHPVIDASDGNVGVWGDYDRDGFLDLFVPTPCPSLYRSNGDRTFRKMTLAEVGPAIQCLRAIRRSGRMSITRAGRSFTGTRCQPVSPRWSMTNHVYHFDSQGMSTLMNIGELSRGREGYAGITWADYDNDGWGFFGREPFITRYKKGFVSIWLETEKQRHPKADDAPTNFELIDQYKITDTKRRLVHT